MSEHQNEDDTTPVLPEQTSDDTDRGWGEESEPAEDDDERILRERPPHW